MAPTICLSELSVQSVVSNSYARRHSRAQCDGIIKQKHRLEIRRTLQSPASAQPVILSPPNSPVWEAAYPVSSCLPSASPAISSRNPTATSFTDNNEHWQTILARRQGLLDIVTRTVVLIRRNHMLQKRLEALRAETKKFMSSVMRDPEAGNTKGQTSLVVKESGHSESLCSRPVPPPTPDSSTDSHLHLARSSTPISSPGSNDDPNFTSDYKSEVPDASSAPTQDPEVSSS